MGNCGEFGCALLVAAANRVLHHWLLRRVNSCTLGALHGTKPYSQIRDDFYAMGHSAGFNDAQ
jgi:hypothetical protein